SPPSRRRGRKCRGLPFPTMLLEVAVRGTPTLSLPATIVDGVTLNCRYKRPHKLPSQPLQLCRTGAIELVAFNAPPVLPDTRRTPGWRGLYLRCISPRRASGQRPVQAAPARRAWKMQPELVQSTGGRG